MTELILQSILLLTATFAVFAVLGAALAGPKKRKATRASVFDEPLALADPEPALVRPEPVRYLDAAAEHFTAGVTAQLRTIDLDRPAYTPFAPSQFETVAVAPPAVTVLDEPANRRVSSLAIMTPESVEAAVQQAGSGLEPLRLSDAQGEPDDLTVISGITPDQQKQLNDYGVYHFWQIAGWSPENVAWVSSRVLSPHRIARENWMAQAARLAKLED